MTDKKDIEDPTGDFGGAGPSYSIREFEKEFGIKTAFGPKDENGKMRWNRCWSNVPRLWAPAIHGLLNKIRAKYRVEGIEDDENSPGIEVYIDQIKVKFGSLRFYFSVQGPNAETSRKDIDKWITECEKELAEIDPYYGVPY